MSDVIRHTDADQGDEADRDVMGELSLEAGALLRSYGQYLRRNQAAPGIGVTDQAALSFLYERRRQGLPSTSTDVTTYLGVSSPSGVAIVDRLAAAGLVTRVPHPDDARKKLIVPSQDAADSPLESAVANAVARIAPGHEEAIGVFLRALADELDAMDSMGGLPRDGVTR